MNCGEICCHLLIPSNHWHMGHPPSGVGEGDVVGARTLESLFSSLVVCISVSKFKSLYNSDLILVKQI